MDCNHDEQPQELTLFEGLKEDLAWVAGAGVVAGACWLFIGDDYAYLLFVPVFAAIYFAVKTIWRRLTHTPRHRRRTGWKTILWSVAAGVVISVVLGFVWDSFRGPSTDSEAAPTRPSGWSPLSETHPWPRLALRPKRWSTWKPKRKPCCSRDLW